MANLSAFLRTRTLVRTAPKKLFIAETLFPYILFYFLHVRVFPLCFCSCIDVHLTRLINITSLLSNSITLQSVMKLVMKQSFLSKKAQAPFLLLYYTAAFRPKTLKHFFCFHIYFLLQLFVVYFTAATICYGEQRLSLT